MGTMNNLEAINNALDIALTKYDNTVVYGEDAGFEGGVFRVTSGLQKKHSEKRVFDSPIAEATLCGSAVGMALAGMHPIVEMQFEGFSYPSLQHLFCHASRMRNRTRGRFTCPMIIRTPMGGGIRALEHHSEAIEAVFAHIPGLKVIIPSTPYDSKGLLLAAVASEDPVIFLEPTKIYRAFKQEIPDDFYTIPIGKAYHVMEGDDLTIVTYGAQVLTCQKAIAQYQKENPDFTFDLIDLRTIKPVDIATIVESVEKTGRLIVVHEAVKSFSVASEIIAMVNERCFDSLQAPCARVTGYDIIIPFAVGEKYHLVSEARVIKQIEATLNYE